MFSKNTFTFITLFLTFTFTGHYMACKEPKPSGRMSRSTSSMLSLHQRSCIQDTEEKDDSELYTQTDGIIFQFFAKPGEKTDIVALRTALTKISQAFQPRIAVNKNFFNVHVKTVCQQAATSHCLIRTTLFKSKKVLTKSQSHPNWQDDSSQLGVQLVLKRNKDISENFTLLVAHFDEDLKIIAQNFNPKANFSDDQQTITEILHATYQASKNKSVEIFASHKA